MEHLPNLSGIEISEPVLHGVIGHYCEEQRRGDSQDAAVIAAWMEDGDARQRRCLSAAAEAIIYSQLISTVIDDGAFEVTLADLRRLDEPELVAMRRDIFEQSFAVASEALVGTDAATRADARLGRVRACLAQS